jgi:hypothetical protein
MGAPSKQILEAKHQSAVDQGEALIRRCPFATHVRR